MVGIDRLLIEDVLFRFVVSEVLLMFIGVIVCVKLVVVVVVGMVLVVVVMVVGFRVVKVCLRNIVLWMVVMMN